MEAFWAIFLFLMGACVGSFLNVVICRLPRGQSIVFPGSHCPKCGRAIRWYDNIPLVSWFALRGRCRWCKEPISPRYVIIETITACLFSGLYLLYFVVHVRQGVGTFAQAWPMYLAHVALLCGLLVSAAVDIEQWIIPLEVMWFCTVVGVAVSAISPHPFMPTVPPSAVAMSLAALAGLAVSIVLVHFGFIQPSFIDADDSPPPQQTAESKNDPSTSRRPQPAVKSVAMTSTHGVNPRKEILRELEFLLPAIALAAGAAAVLRYVPSAARAWGDLLDPQLHPHLAPHLLCGGSALFGYLIGGAWIWGTRILGTLGFGKEAMGLGDVHILAAVGAVTGWIVPSIAFFLAPFFGLLWAMYLWLGRGQRELPYGPWLAISSAAVMFFYDGLIYLLTPYADSVSQLWQMWTG